MGFPLSCLLAIQVVVVAAAFVAAITVLSEQQRSDFRIALEKQLSMQRATALRAIADPLLQRKDLFNVYVQQYVNGNNNDKKYIAPADEPGMTDSHHRLLSFYNHFYILPYLDPMITVVSVANESATVYADYEVGGSKQKNGTKVIWNLWGIDNFKMGYVHNEQAVGCLGLYPIDPSSCFLYAQYLDTPIARGDPLSNNQHTLWAPPGMLEDATVEGGLSYITSYTINPNPAHRPYCVFAISFSLKHVKANILANVATPTSVTAIYAHYRYVVDNTREYLLFGGKFGFAEFNAEALALHGGDYYYATWRGGRTPDPVLNAVFRKAEFMFLNTTSSGAFEVTHGGSDYVASAARIYDPDTRLDWLLTEHTPREEFYAASDTARLAGILIGVAGALVVLATCIFIWAIIRFPLRLMHTSMDLAADMRNDEVVHIDPLLSEVQDLSEAFRQMNSKLLASRPFLPQSLLRAINNADEENQSEGDARRQDDDELMSTPSVAVASNRLEEGSAARGDTVASQKSNQMVRKRLNGFDRDMSHRRVGILSINVIAFHTALTTTTDHHQQVGSCSSGLSAIMSAHSTLADIIEQVTKEERGIVDYFHGDRFVCGFNTARACGSPARNAAETSNKIWERFLSNKILSQTFPSGLSMGLSVGKAAVGNHGTETMQRLATIGDVYTEAMRLQEVMSRRLLNNNSRTENVSSSILAGRCLTTAHVFSDLETSNIPFQILGSIHPHLFQTASHNDKISLKEETGMKRPFGHNDNTSLRKETRAKPNFEISLREEGMKSYGYGSLLIAAIASSERSNATVEEWLYHFNKDDMSARNPYATVNAALQRMWRFKNDRDQKLAVDLDKAALVELAMSFRMPSDKAINYSDGVLQWLEYVTNTVTTSATADEVRNKLSYLRDSLI